MKRITITLSDKAEEYFNDVIYSLDNGDGKVATHSQVINHCLEELALFEENAGQDLTGYLREYWPQIFEDKKTYLH